MTPLDIITSEIDGPEVRKDGHKKLNLSWIGTCPGQLSCQQWRIQNLALRGVWPMGGSPGDVGEATEWLVVTQVKQRKGWIMSCDGDEATEGLDNEENDL